MGCSSLRTNGLRLWRPSWRVKRRLTLHPLTDLQAVGVSPPCPAAQFTITENNLLLHDAISTFFVALGMVKIQRLITTYTSDSNGNSDTSFLNLETMNTLRYLRFDFRRQMSHSSAARNWRMIRPTSRRGRSS